MLYADLITQSPLQDRAAARSMMWMVLSRSSRSLAPSRGDRYHVFPRVYYKIARLRSTTIEEYRIQYIKTWDYILTTLGCGLDIVPARRPWGFFVGYKSFSKKHSISSMNPLGLTCVQ